MEKDRILINKDLIPYKFSITLGMNMYTFEVRYNETKDIFTIALYGDGNTLVCIEPLTYGVPLFSQTYRLGFPAMQIVPIDESGETTIITKDNFNKTVFLTIYNDGEQYGE